MLSSELLKVLMKIGRGDELVIGDGNYPPPAEWAMNRFLPLGQGTVDFKGVYKALKHGGYDGVLCVELDKQPVCNYRSAQISREYLHNTIGL